jgi:hypothetical protein
MKRVDSIVSVKANIISYLSETIFNPNRTVTAVAGRRKI